MENLIFTKENKIGILTFNRPESKNSLDAKTYDELFELIPQIDKDEDVRVLIITGAGDSFCAGINLSFAASLKDASPAWMRWFIKKVQVTFSFEKMRQPVISAVRGHAVGNGCDIAVASDFIIASETAKFAMAYTTLGLVPDAGGTYRLTRLIGPSKAKELILTGERIDAKRAYEIGMVTKVVPDDKLMDEAMALAIKLAKRAPLALSMSKAAIDNALSGNFCINQDLELYMQGVCIPSHDATEAVISFLEKRDGNFIGK
ncbi:MAG: hypothetical protein APR62_05730 [Smithella sp. SDB]|nr:MAG: hypothetical protein APR62_05730 [Smithella sp. SDB]